MALAELLYMWFRDAVSDRTEVWGWPLYSDVAPSTRQIWECFALRISREFNLETGERTGDIG
jgi:hypothetical protein